MTLFFVLAAAMVLLAVTWMLFGLFHEQADNSADQLAVNVSIARERQLTLRDALDRGDIDQTTFDQEHQDLERSLAADLGPHTGALPTAGGPRRGVLAAAAFVGVVTPLVSGLLYLQLGTPRALDPEFLASAQAVAPGASQGQGQAAGQGAGTAPGQAPSMETLLPQLEQKLAENPDDATGWALLGRTQLALGQFVPAIEAFGRANTLEPGNPTVLASLAEASAMSVDGELQGEPERYLEQALAIDPQHPQAVWLMAIAHQQAGRYAQAVESFDTLLPLVEADSEARSTIEQMRAEAAAASSNGAGPADPSPTDEADDTGARAAVEPTPSDSVPDTTGNPAAPAASIRVRVSLDEAIAREVRDDQVVFVYARASEGPSMPLAAQKLSVADLPAEITLDDSMAMMPNLVMSGFKTLTVGARVSATGNATGGPGDWYAELESVPSDTADTLDLVIDTQRQ